MFPSPDYFLTPAGICLLLLAFFTIIQLFYYWFYFARVAFYKNNNHAEQSQNPPVTVVICAKNEYENLTQYLPLVLEQDYPDFEVILVNDFSEDESFFLLKSYEDKYPHFKVIHLRENVNFFQGKKLALAVGIKSAKNDIILLIDADCRPVGRDWIKKMTTQYTTNGTEIVLGYGGYDEAPGLLNKLIRYDTTSIAIQYMGMALAGSPYMGVGRNLSYRKSLFFKNGGFASHYKVKSGDDDLFVNKASEKHNTRVVLDPESHTFSAPKRTFASWFSQKKRHLTTGKYYKFADKFRLGLYYISSLMFYVTLIASLVLDQSFFTIGVVIGLFLLRNISMIIIHYNAGKKFLEQKLFLYSPIFDIIFVFFNPVFALSNLFYRKNKWK